jgi:hypothetical protein
MSNARRTINQLQSEIERDLSQFNTEFVNNLRATTPIRTGQARRGWQNTYNGLSGGKTKIAQNNVGYIDVLNKGSSRQAPRGIIGPALSRTRKP